MEQTQIQKDFETYYAEQKAVFDGIDVQVLRQRWRDGVRDSKALARYLAEKALQDFANSGNLNLLNEYLDDLSNSGKNYVRREPYLKWCIAHQPLKLENNKLVKDRDTEITESQYEMLLVQAMQVPFWDFAPEKAIAYFGAGDLVTKLESVLKSFENKKHVPKDQDAVNLLAVSRSKVAELRRLVPLESVIMATPASAAIHKPEGETVETVEVVPANDNREVA